MSQPNPIRLAIIGTGLIVSSQHWPAINELGAEYQVVALANRTPGKAEALADDIAATTGARPVIYTDHRELLAREPLDAVSLALPTYLNPEITEAALSAGCHVIAEKPIAASLADARPMLDWPARYGRQLMIAENYRYTARFTRAAELIAAGAIGEPRLARWNVHAYMGPNNPYYRTAWRQEPAHPGGYISDGGVHLTAVLRMLVGEVVSVTAQAAALRPDLPPLDTVSASLRFANGAMGTYAVTYALPGPELPLVVAGADGALLISHERVELWRAGEIVQAWVEPSPHGGMVGMYADFARSVRTGQPPLSTATEGYEDLRLIVAMLRAAEEGREVKVAEVD